jgi:hypothetical protein
MEEAKKDEKECCCKEEKKPCGCGGGKSCCGCKVAIAIILFLLGGVIGYLKGMHCRCPMGGHAMQMPMQPPGK